MRERGLLFAGLLVLILGAVVGYVALRPGPIAAPASPSPGATATPVPTPSQTAAALSHSPTPAASPSPSQGRFVNAVLGYSIDLAPPWRWSDCLSGSHGSGEDLMAHDAFVTVPEYDESAGSTGFRHDSVIVHAKPNPSGLTPRQWYEAGQMGQSLGDVLFLSADELAAARAAPTPTPLPPRSPEEVADILAEGFAKKDVALLATVITPSCVSLGVNRGAGQQWTTGAISTSLRTGSARASSWKSVLDRSRVSAPVTSRR